MSKPEELKSILHNGSDHYDGSVAGSTSGKSAQSRMRMMLENAKKKEKEREAHPERRLLFRPKVYEAWKDEDIDDEIAEREKLIQEITAREAEMQKKKDAGEIDSDDDEDDNLAAQKAALERLKNRRQREEAYRGRLEAEQAREDAERLAAEEEKAFSELTNPSVYGWFYTDGYYENNPFFGVKDDIIEKMNEDQEVWRENWLIKHPESFTDKFKRFFWPPKLLFKNKMFRTRGKYMDFPEVIADWPKGVEINFEHGDREIVNNSHTVFKDEKDLDLDALNAELENELDPDAIFKSQPTDDGKLKIHIGKPGKDLNWDDWYYDDRLGEFHRKTDAFMIEYYMDSKNNCWRLKRPQKRPPERQPTPYDWYFDFDTRTFLARADFKDLHSHEFAYDEKNSVYRIKTIIPTGTKKGSRNSRKEKTSLKKTKSATNVDGTDEKSKSTIRDFYFDEEEGKWLLISELPEEKKDLVEWDENGRRYALKVEGEWRGLTGYSPDDYFFDDKFGRFNLKPVRQGKDFKYYSKDGVWRKNSAPPPDKNLSVTTNTPNEYYFDEFEGQFKVKEQGAINKYWRQKYSLIWRKHDEPRSGMYPEDFYWDRERKQWLPRSIRMEMLKNSQLAKSQWASEITRGATKNTGNIRPDSFFWDIEEGRFALKTKNMKYYFDTDGFWKSTKLRDKQRNRIFPHDYYYDHKEKEFVRKNKPESYIFNASANVWTLPDCPEKLEIKFYYDVEEEGWVVDDDQGNEEEGNTVINTGIAVKPHSNETIKIPDDFWFDENEGRFFPKEPENAKNYYYNSTDGVWRKKGDKNTIPNYSGLNPRNFFFDDQASKFKLKVDGHKKDYWYDNNNKIFRHIISAGETRSGYQPRDFTWSSELKSYILDKSQDRQRGKVVNELPEWDPLRRYSKGWLIPPKDPTLPQNVKGAKTNHDKKKKSN